VTFMRHRKWRRAPRSSRRDGESSLGSKCRISAPISRFSFTLGPPKFNYREGLEPEQWHQRPETMWGTARHRGAGDRWGSRCAGTRGLRDLLSYPACCSREPREQLLSPPRFLKGTLRWLSRASRRGPGVGRYWRPLFLPDG
jgi:hypothetical protein